MTHLSLRGGRYLAALLLAGATFFGTALQAAQPGKSNKGKKKGGTATVSVTSYSGRAIALRIDDVEVPVPGPIIVADTGPLPSSGGHIEVSEANVNVGNGALTVGLAYAVTSGAGTQAASDTTLSEFHVEIVTPAHGSVMIDADYIAASASASLEANSSTTLDANVTVQGLRVDGNPVVVTGQPNQVVNIPGGKIVIDERTNVAGGGSGDIAVTAVHFYVDDCMNGAIGTVHAGITGCDNPPPPEPGDCGKLTGGGWILGPSGAKASFGVSGGIRRGEFWGHLNYIDHGTGMHVKSTAVTGFQPNPSVPDCRIISYDVMIDGVPGTAVVDAWDRGEPGRDDFFSIQLSTGYSARGTLGGDGPGGGNLQLHKCPPGWAK